jgi:hypothetical protein
MWISEEEANIRLHGNRNLLNRVQRDSDYEDTTLEPVVPSVDEILIDPAQRAHTRKRSPNLNKSEAADAAVIGQAVSNRYAAQMYQKTPAHVQMIHSNKSQGHDGSPPNPELASLIEDQRTKIRDVAFARLGTIMECLDENKIKKVDKARELSAIGLQIATIAEKMLPKDMQAEQNVHFHMFRPEVKKESEYESVEVGEERNASPRLVEGQVLDSSK